MSINSWKKEFYKGRLRDATRTPLAAVEHSLQKWEGLAVSNLKKHGLISVYGVLNNPETDAQVAIGADNCALCEMYAPSCQKCPIVLATDKPCDGDDSPYGDWTTKDNPTRMIAVLKLARKYVLEYMQPKKESK